MSVILVINPGSTSTKLAIYQDDQELFCDTLTHSLEELKTFDSVFDQFAMRKQNVIDFLHQHNIELSSIDICVGRGGLLHPLPSGVYRVNQKMLDELRAAPNGEHASNLGAPIAYELAKEIGQLRQQQILAVIVDPVIVDELDDVARIAGHPLFTRKSIFHALGQKAAARRYAQLQNHQYEQMNLIVAHLGGGITVGAHCKGKVIEVNNGLDGEGPMSPERSGTLPMGEFLKLAQRKTFAEMKLILKGQGGMGAYLGTSDAREVEKMITTGDAKAKLIYDAMAYQVAAAIGSCATALRGKVDAIILSGGLAKSELFTTLISERVEFIANVHINLSEVEMSALAEGAQRALDNIYIEY